MNKKFELVERAILFLQIFLLPTQLAFHWWPQFSFVYGIRVDYLAPTLYLTDVLVFILIAIWIYLDAPSFLKLLKRYYAPLLLILLLATVNTLLSTSAIITLLKWLKLFELLVFVGYLFVRAGRLGYKNIYNSLFTSLIFFSLIGIAQFLMDHTTGLFYLLGERQFNVSTPSIALAQISGRDFLRAYSTFPHPNSFAGYLAASLLFLLTEGYFKKNTKAFLGIAPILLAIALTFSLSAFLGILVVAVLFLFRENTKIFTGLILGVYFVAVIASLLLPVFSREVLLRNPLLGQSVSQRLDLGYIAGQMISEKFFFGEGLNTFIINIPHFKGIFSFGNHSSSWILQPVHNIFLLVFAEAGIFGLLLLLYAFYKIFRVLFSGKKHLVSLTLIFVVVTGILDHYWFSIQQNLLLISLLLGLSINPHTKNGGREGI